MINRTLTPFVRDLAKILHTITKIPYSSRNRSFTINVVAFLMATVEVGKILIRVLLLCCAIYNTRDDHILIGLLYA